MSPLYGSRRTDTNKGIFKEVSFCRSLKLKSIPLLEDRFKANADGRLSIPYPVGEIFHRGDNFIKSSWGSGRFNPPAKGSDLSIHE